MAAAGEHIAGFEHTMMTACMRLQRRDEMHWPDAAGAEALYLHKPAVRRAATGKGWTGRMIVWAAGSVAFPRGLVHARAAYEGNRLCAVSVFVCCWPAALACPHLSRFAPCKDQALHNAGRCGVMF